MSLIDKFLDAIKLNDDFDQDDDYLDDENEEPAEEAAEEPVEEERSRRPRAKTRKRFLQKFAGGRGSGTGLQPQKAGKRDRFIRAVFPGEPQPREGNRHQVGPPRGRPHAEAVEGHSDPRQKEPVACHGSQCGQTFFHGGHLGNCRHTARWLYRSH